jgi:hypothetical protein
MINKFFKSTLFLFLVLLGNLFFANNVSASKLYLSPTQKNVSVNSEFEINLIIDTEGTQVFGSETKIVYPTADIELKSVTNGGFFTDFSSPSGTGSIEIRGYFSSMYETKSGSGNFAVLKFSTKKDSGNGVISFDCTSTQILNSTGDNVLSCSTLNQTNLTYSSSTGGTTTPTDSPNQEANSCGGTCGSNYNCKSEFFCYQGFCRNSACPTESDCTCAVSTPIPTTKPRATQKALATPQVITLEEFSTVSANVVNENEEPLNEEEVIVNENKFNISRYLPYAVLLFIIVSLTALIFRIRKNTNKNTTENFIPLNPQINPPDNIQNPPQNPASPNSQVENNNNSSSNPPPTNNPNL